MMAQQALAAKLKFDPLNSCAERGELISASCALLHVLWHTHVRVHTYIHSSINKYIENFATCVGE